MNNIGQLEERINYRFSDISLLDTALTHSSFIKEHSGTGKSNERLEFLGDAFLDAIISVELFQRMAGETEGKLTKTRALIVCEGSLAAAAIGLNLGTYMNLGHGEESAGGRSKDSILADCVEAIIGALYLDGGYDAAREFVLELLENTINEAVEGKIFLDYKSEVQEILQSSGVPVNIVYVIDREEGPAHDKTFFVHMECNGKTYGSGSGKNKKEAEQNAARQTLYTLKRGETF